jgi:phage baseplate assembly protein V
MYSWLMSKIKNMIKRGSIQSLDDTGPVPRIVAKIFGRNNLAGLIQPYGHIAVPPVGAQVVLFNLLAQESNKLAIAYDAQNRIKGFDPGTTGLENYLTGDHIILSPDGSIQINSASGAHVIINSGGTVEITAPVNITGNVDITGDLDVSGAIRGTPGIDLVTHIHTDSIGGPTTTPQ